MNTTTKPFDPTKPVQTRDGRKARILAVDIQDTDYTIAAAVTHVTGIEAVYSFTSEGCYTKASTDPCDLINIPTKIKVEGWVNVYPSNFSIVHSTKEKADRDATTGRLACKHISFEVEEGEGL